MSKIETLIAYLIAIQSFAKDIHYTVSGDAFYSKHKFADYVAENIDEFIDELKETCYLANSYIPAITPKYWDIATTFYPDRVDADYKNIIALRNLIIDAVGYLNTLPNFSRAENAILDNIAQDLQRKLGLLNRQVG